LSREVSSSCTRRHHTDLDGPLSNEGVKNVCIHGDVLLDAA
jgi:hypothetical protein